MVVRPLGCHGEEHQTRRPWALSCPSPRVHGRRPQAGRSVKPSPRRGGAAPGLSERSAPCRGFAEVGIILTTDWLMAASAQGLAVAPAAANVSDFPMAELTLEHWPAG